jgi:ketosteroid isomerase-like protein
MTQANVEVVRRGWDAWLRGDLPGLFSNVDPEVVWDTSHFHDWPESAYHGIEGVERFLTEWLEVWADYEVEVEDIIAAPDGRVVSLLLQRGRGRDFKWKCRRPWSRRFGTGRSRDSTTTRTAARRSKLRG